MRVTTFPVESCVHSVALRQNRGNRWFNEGNESWRHELQAACVLMKAHETLWTELS